jgi:hypothetical protein
MTGYMRRSRLARLLADHDRNEADLKALADALAEDKACDEHGDELLRKVRDMVRKAREPKAEQ